MSATTGPDPEAEPGGPPSDGGKVKVSLNKTATGPRTMKVKEVLKQVGSMRRAAEVDKILAELDRDQDGTIDVNELLNMVEGVIKSRRERRYMWFAIIALFVFAVATIGTIVGLTYAVVDALKDTQVTGGTMYVKGSTTEVVRTGSAEFSVVDGVMVSRSSLMDANGTNAANTTTPPAQAVLQTASFLGTPQSFNSRLDIRTLFELKYLYIKGTGGAEMGVMVTGVARVPQGFLGGSVVRMITTAGTITLDGTAITFSSIIADIFQEAGFRVSSNRRALLGIYDVLGFFNTIKDLSVFNLPSDQAKPQLPSENFLIKLKVYEPCLLPDTPMGDRCIYTPPKDPVSDGYELSDGAIPNAPLWPMPSAAIPPFAPGWELPTAPPSEDQGLSAGRRRHLHVRTAPHRSLQGAEALGEDLAGVEVVDGVRYMTHNETAVMWTGFVRTVYDYALYPKYQKIELIKPSSDKVFVWQQEALAEGSTNDVNLQFCRNYSMPQVLVGKGFTSDSVVDFTYEGVDTVNERLARRFRLVIKQRLNTSTTVTVDYWDSLEDQTPVAFQFEHPAIGTGMIHVLEFRSLTATSPEIARSSFVEPDMDTCPGSSATVPRLTSPFAVRGQVSSGGVVAERRLSEDQRFMMLEESAVRAAAWEQLDHVNGTGEWPQWALDQYGGVHPAQMRRNGRALLAEDCTKITSSLTIPAGPCDAQIKIINSKWLAGSLACGGNVGPVTVKGGFDGNMCELKIKGCIKFGIGLGSSNWLVRKLGMDGIDILEICAGYDGQSGVFFLEATLTLWLMLAKAEASVVFKFSACCTWIEEVKIEGFIGIDLGFFDAWYSIGDIKFLEDKYLRGSPLAADSEVNPTVINEYRWLTVSDGWWGDWKKAVYCGENLYAVSTTGTGSKRFWGRPVISFQLRIEDITKDGDDTSLNGLKVQCMDGDTLVVEQGNWGSGWYGPATAATGKFFTAAKMRLEKKQASGVDDTAANNIIFKSNDGKEMKVAEGWWGDWLPYVSCATNTYICGFSVRYEKPQDDGDDTTFNGLKIICCSWYAVK